LIRINYFSPENLVKLGVLLYVILPFSYYSFISDERLIHSFDITEFSVFFPLICYIFGIGFLEFFKAPFFKIKNPDSTLVSSSRLLVVLLFLFVFNYFLFWYINRSYGFNSEAEILINILRYRLAIERDAASVLIARNFITVSMIFCCVSAWYAYKMSSKKLFAIVLVLGMVEFLYFSFLSGRRRDLISLVLLFAFFVNFSSLFNKKRPGIDVGKTAVFTLFFIVLMSWYSFFRASREFSNENNSLIYEFVRRFDGVYPNFHYLVNSGIGSDWLFGLSYVRAPLNFIPRGWFSEKHHNLQMEFNESLRIYADSGMDFGSFGELWVNFGVLSLLFTAIYLYLIRGFFRFIYDGVSRLSFVSTNVYAFVLYSFLQFFSSPVDSTNMMFFIINMFFIVALSVMVIRKRHEI
jgi:hypothetical protein